MTCSVSELYKKDIINISTGCRIGCVSDIVIDSSSGQLLSLSAERTDGQFGFRRATIRICWEDIIVIGKETVLVKNYENTEDKKGGSKKIFDIFKSTT